MNASRLMSAARQTLAGIPKCGAFARSTGLPCQKPGLGAGGRCRHHGGASTGRPIVMGNYMRERALTNDWCRLLLGLVYEIHGKPKTSSGWVKPGRLSKARIRELLKWQGIEPPVDL